MKKIGIVVSLLSVCLVACTATGQDDSIAEGALSGPSLDQAKKVVKDFYASDLRMKDRYPELTAEANAKIAAAWAEARQSPYFNDGGFEIPFTGTSGHFGVGRVTIDAPAYAFGLKEAIMTVHAKNPATGGDNLATVRVRLADLKIADISLNVHECSGGAANAFAWDLVGNYDMKSAYPSADGGAGRVEVYWNGTTKENCVVARCVERCGEKIPRSLKVRVDGADWVTDAGDFAWWAGPVKVTAPNRCIDVRANFGHDGVAGSTKFDNKHCG